MDSPSHHCGGAAARLSRPGCRNRPGLRRSSLRERWGASCGARGAVAGQEACPGRWRLVCCHERPMLGE
eukprot:9540430-Alexandrium_andersonii.AAC.1